MYHCRRLCFYIHGIIKQTIDTITLRKLLIAEDRHSTQTSDERPRMNNVNTINLDQSNEFCTQHPPLVRTIPNFPNPVHPFPFFAVSANDPWQHQE